MSSKLKPTKRVAIRWHDPSTTDGWSSREAALNEEGPVMVSTGWLVGETETEFVIAMDWCIDDANVNSIGRIRKALVTGYAESGPPKLKPYPPKVVEVNVECKD